ncbi:MAG: cupin domain-containing protein [Hyphomicrobiales bacterium]
MTKTALEIIETLNLEPHPEGGHYRETFRDDDGHGGRAHSTAIYYLLRHGERSHWHRVDAVEVWHWYSGSPLALMVWEEGAAFPSVRRLGPDVEHGEEPQAVVPKHAWQSAVSLGDWTLCGCTVSPGFEREGFELAPPGWEPPGA